MNLRITCASNGPLKRLFHEIVIWRRLSHPNVLPVLGISPKLFPLCIVSEWMIDGNIADFASNHPEVNRLRLVRSVSVVFSIPKFSNTPSACGSSEWIAVSSLGGNHPQRPQARAYYHNLRKLSLTISYRQTSLSTGISTLASLATDSLRLYRIWASSALAERIFPPICPFDTWHRNYSIPQASVWTPVTRQRKVTSMPWELWRIKWASRIMHQLRQLTLAHRSSQGSYPTLGLRTA